MEEHVSFVDKYRPQTINDLILNDKIKNMLMEYINKKTICHMSLCGRPGIGKTSLANIIAKELDAPFLEVCCGQDGGVDMVKDRVQKFCDAGFSCDVPKIILLDEADCLSRNSGTGSSAQASLKNIIEKNNDDTRFILTANDKQSIMEALPSRCTHINLTYNIESVAKRCAEILTKESIKFTTETFTEFIEKVVKKTIPRYSINY